MEMPPRFGDRDLIDPRPLQPYLTEISARVYSEKGDDRVLPAKYPTSLIFFMVRGKD